MHSRDQVLAPETGFQMHSQFQCSKVCPNQVPRLRLKSIRSREQNSTPDSRRTSLYTVKVIKMSRLAILFACLFYGRFAGHFVVAKQTMKQTAQLFYPQTRKTLREDYSDAPETSPETVAFFNCAYLFAWLGLKFFCLLLTEITQIGLIRSD